MSAQALKLNVSGAFLRRTDFSRASLVRANLSRADFSHAAFVGSDFKDAILDGTVLIGADLTDAKNLTIDQLSRAIVDRSTRLPAYLSLEQIKPAA